jgi:hypothetical protein
MTDVPVKRGSVGIQISENPTFRAIDGCTHVENRQPEDMPAPIPPSFRIGSGRQQFEDCFAADKTIDETILSSVPRISY